MPMKVPEELNHIPGYWSGKDGTVRTVLELDHDNIRWFVVDENGFSIGESVTQPRDQFDDWSDAHIGNMPQHAIQYYKERKAMTDEAKSEETEVASYVDHLKSLQLQSGVLGDVISDMDLAIRTRGLREPGVAEAFVVNWKRALLSAIAEPGVAEVLWQVCVIKVHDAPLDQYAMRVMADKPEVIKEVNRLREMGFSVEWFTLPVSGIPTCDGAKDPDQE